MLEATQESTFLVYTWLQEVLKTNVMSDLTRICRPNPRWSNKVMEGTDRQAVEIYILKSLPNQNLYKSFRDSQEKFLCKIRLFTPDWIWSILSFKNKFLLWEVSEVFDLLMGFFLFITTRRRMTRSKGNIMVYQIPSSGRFKVFIFVHSRLLLRKLKKGAVKRTSRNT